MRSKKHGIRNHTLDSRIKYYIIYTGFFVVIFTISFSWFFMNNKSLIWQNDGIRQYFITLVYYGKYLRQIVRGVIENGTIKIPMFEFSIGYGADIITTLHGNPIGDPLNLFSVFFTAEKTEFLYCTLTILRVYLTGITFSLYCRYMKKPAYNTLVGTIIYAFCGYSIFVVVRHPFFLNPMIYLPLLLIGAEKIFAKQRPYLFIIMVLISAVSNFYFFYMLTIFVIIYTAIRVFVFIPKERKRSIFRWFGKFTLCYSIGLLMAGITFLPVAMLSLGIARGGANNSSAVDALYKPFYYESFASAFITQRSPGYWNIMGYSVVSLIAVVLLFTKKKEYSQLKIGFIILTLCLLLPIAGHILHGFSYVTNRWVWGYSFVVALITVVMTPDILNPSKRQFRVVSFFTVFYFLHGIIFPSARTEEFFATFAILLILFMLLFSTQYIDQQKNKRFPHASMRKIVVLSFIAFGVSIQAFYRFAPNKGNYINEFRKPGDALSMQTENPSALIKELKDESFFRYETNSFGGQSVIQNPSLLNQQNSTDFYFSLINPYIGKFLNDDNYFVGNTYNVRGLESRAILGALADVKYFVVKPGLERFIPYGYEEIIYQDKDYNIYYNQYALPIGYTYDRIISEAQYRELSAIEKQQALLQGAVVMDGMVNKLSSINPQFNHSILSYEMECGNGIAFVDGAFIVNNTKSSVKLSFDGLSECETYFGIYDLHFSQTNPIGNPDGAWAGLSWIEKIRFIWKNHTWTAPDNVTIGIKSGDISRSFTNSTPYYQFYEGKHDYLINLFYSSEKKVEIEITFSATGSYKVSGMEVICLPMEAFGSQIESLRDTVLENVNIEVNRITGTVDADRDMLLCLSIPYNGGWHAYIDSEEVEMLNVNTMYNGVYLTTGYHNIEFRYMTPYLEQGVVLSIIGICLFGIIAIICEKGRKYKLVQNDKSHLV